jgi:hypothetical protein
MFFRNGRSDIGSFSAQLLAAALLVLVALKDCRLNLR